jgi:hypothetical protein
VDEARVFDRAACRIPATYHSGHLYPAIRIRTLRLLKLIARQSGRGRVEADCLRQAPGGDGASNGVIYFHLEKALAVHKVRVYGRCL